jgi:hypothetical protein
MPPSCSTTLVKASSGQRRGRRSKYVNILSLSFILLNVHGRRQEPYARITFSAYPTCHDVNLATVAPDRVDIIIGFSTGDIVWFGTFGFSIIRRIIADLP